MYLRWHIGIILHADLTVGIYFFTVHEATCRFSLYNNISSSLHQHLIQSIETKYLIYDLFQALAQNINSIFLLSRIRWSHIFFLVWIEQRRWNTNVKANLQRKTIPSIPRCISSPFPLLFGRQAAFEVLSGSLLFHVRQMKAFNVGAKGSVWIITRGAKLRTQITAHSNRCVTHTHTNTQSKYDTRANKQAIHTHVIMHGYTSPSSLQAHVCAYKQTL